MVSPDFIRVTKQCIYKIFVHSRTGVAGGIAFTIGQTGVLFTLARFFPESLDNLHGLSMVREKHDVCSELPEEMKLEQTEFVLYGNGDNFQIFKDNQLAIIDFPLKYFESCLNFGDADLLRELDSLYLVGFCDNLLAYSEGVLSSKDKSIGLVSSEGRDVCVYQMSAAGNVEQLGSPVFSVDGLVVGVYFYKLITIIDQPELAYMLGVDQPVYTNIFQENANIFLPSEDIIKFLNVMIASGPESLRDCIREECQSICGEWNRKYRF